MLRLLWRGLAVVAPIQPLAWELPDAVDAALKRRKKKKKKKKKERLQCVSEGKVSVTVQRGDTREVVSDNSQSLRLWPKAARDSMLP